MTEQINDQISAFIDDELSAEESALLVRRFERDPASRAQAMRYTLIGSALRGEPDPQAALLRRRLAAALDGAPQSARPIARRQQAWFVRPLAGVGIAAAVAVLAIGTLRFVNEAPPDASVASTVAAAIPVQASNTVPAPSYVVPLEAAAPNVVTPPIRLTNYLVHHGEYASGLSRTSVNSNVVSASDVPPRETIEVQP